MASLVRELRECVLRTLTSLTRSPQHLFNGAAREFRDMYAHTCAPTREAQRALCAVSAGLHACAREGPLPNFGALSQVPTRTRVKRKSDAVQQFRDQYAPAPARA